MYLARGAPWANGGARHCRRCWHRQSSSPLRPRGAPGGGDPAPASPRLPGRPRWARSWRSWPRAACALPPAQVLRPPGTARPPSRPPSAIAVADVWRLPCEAVTVPGPGVPSPPPRQLETRSFICIYMISLCSLRDGEIYLLLSLMFDYTRRRRRAAKCTDASLGARGPEGPVTQQRVWLDAGETNSILKKADARGWKERTS